MIRSIATFGTVLTIGIHRATFPGAPVSPFTQLLHMPTPSRPALAATNSRNLTERLFGLDLRSLAMFRIGAGVLLLTGLAYRIEDLSAHYSDYGALPRAARIYLNLHEQFTAPPYWMSLQMLSGDVWFQGLLLAVAGVLAFAVLIGYRTTWTMLASWIMLVSLQARNPLVLQGGDDLLRLMLFWACLLPCGAVWSYDATQTAPPSQPRHTSLATAGMLLQLVCMYVFTALLKTGAAWRVDFDAIYYALSLDHFTTRFGYWLLGYPSLLKVLTAATFVLEFVGPLALFLPWGNARARMVTFLAFAGLHLGIALTLHLGMFSWICIVCWLIILPTEFWDRLHLKVSSRLTSSRRRTGRRQSPPGVAFGWFGNGLCILLLLHMLLLNVVRLHGGIESQLSPGPIRWAGKLLAQDQYWCMFSPSPLRFGSWLRLEGIRPDGSRVNLLHVGQEILDRKPSNVAATYRSQRWRKYLMNLMERESPVHRTAVAQFLLARWAATHPADPGFQSVEVICMCTPTPPPGDRQDHTPAITEVLVWRHHVAQPLATTAGSPRTTLGEDAIIAPSTRVTKFSSASF